MAIPDGQVRAINDIGVFVVTAGCSIFAYIWLLLVLQVTQCLLASYLAEIRLRCLRRT